MKGPWSWMMFILFVHVMLSIFMMVGSFGSFADRTSVDEWGILDVADFLGVTGFSGIGIIGIGAFTMAISIVAGVSPFLSMAYGLVVGLYVGTWTKLFGLISGIATDAGEFGFIINMVALITATAFGYLLVKTLIEMSASPRYGT